MAPSRWLAALLLLLLTACTSLTEKPTSSSALQSCGGAHVTEIIVGAHRNAPRPKLPEVLECHLLAAIEADRPVRLVIASGRPQIVAVSLPTTRGGSLAEQNSPRAHENLETVKRAITTARPNAPGVDDLAALALAADDARSLGDTSANLMLLDTGLSDEGAFDLTADGLLPASPDEVVTQLRATKNLPQLRGFTVFLVGLGYTAPPQTPLSDKWRTRLTQLWHAILQAAGAKVVTIPQPNQSPPVDTDLPVRQIPVPPDDKVKPKTGSQIIFNDASPVSFKPRSDAFLDRGNAREALAPIAEWLRTDERRRARLVGTTADVGSLLGQVQLSKLRARRVHDELVALGVSPRQLSIDGVGSHFPEFTPDRDAAGTLLAGPATLNRSVRIRLR